MPTSSWSRPVRAAACAAVLTAALSACSSEALDVEGFAPGACTDIAATLQDVDEALRQLADDDIEPRDAADRFRVAQEQLGAAAEGGGAVAEQVQELITRQGFFRLAVDTGAVDTDASDGEQQADVQDALDALAETCRA